MAAQRDVTAGGRRQASGLILSARRALGCVAAGVAVGAVMGLVWTPELAPLSGWTVASGLAVAWVWRVSWSQGPEGTKRLAEEESRSRSTDAWVVAAAVASLGVVVIALMRSSGRSPVAVASVLLALASVLLAWTLVNTVFALKYARLYYLDEPDREGFDFKQENDPTYSDFAYVAFTIGMSYAVSETEPTQTRIRRVALGHALLSYLFGTGVLAVGVNLVTNLGQS